MAKDARKPEFWNKFLQRPEVQAAMRTKLKYESYAEAAQRTKLDKLERKQRRYEIMHELMQCATNVKHLVSPMFRYKITQQYLWKVLSEARKEGILFCDKLRQPQVYHRLMAIKAEITAGPYGVAGWQAEEEVEEDLMDKMVVEADCIPGGIDGEAPDRKQVLDKREIQGVLDFGQQIKSEGNEAFANENWEGALTRYCQGDEMLKNFAAEPHLNVCLRVAMSSHHGYADSKQVVVMATVVLLMSEATSSLAPQPTPEPTPEPTPDWPMPGWPTLEPTPGWPGDGWPTPDPTLGGPMPGGPMPFLPMPEPTPEPTPGWSMPFLPMPEPTPEPTPVWPMPYLPMPEATPQPTPQLTRQPTPDEPMPEEMPKLVSSPALVPAPEPTPERTPEATPEVTPKPMPKPTSEPTPKPTTEPTSKPTTEPTREPPVPNSMPSTSESKVEGSLVVELPEGQVDIFMTSPIVRRGLKKAIAEIGGVETNQVELILRKVTFSSRRLAHATLRGNSRRLDEAASVSVDYVITLASGQDADDTVASFVAVDSDQATEMIMDGIEEEAAGDSSAADVLALTLTVTEVSAPIVTASAPTTQTTSMLASTPATQTTSMLASTTMSQAPQTRLGRGGLPCGDTPSPVCTTDSAELCRYDESCSHHPPWRGGLGCNAGGVGQDCRFCGFGHYLPCDFDPANRTLPCTETPEAVCAGPLEPCYRDPQCSARPPSLGGLGCNAGGTGQDCRFCGFGAFPACPGLPSSLEF